jgi:hypothetical protein
LVLGHDTPFEACGSTKRTAVCEVPLIAEEPLDLLDKVARALGRRLAVRFVEEKMFQAP